jgi:hypothetical protein
MKIGHGLYYSVVLNFIVVVIHCFVSSLKQSITPPTTFLVHTTCYSPHGYNNRKTAFPSKPSNTTRGHFYQSFMPLPTSQGGKPWHSKFTVWNSIQILYMLPCLATSSSTLLGSQGEIWLSSCLCSQISPPSTLLLPEELIASHSDKAPTLRGSF